MSNTYRANADAFVIPWYEPAPGLGVLPINAYLIHSKEQVLVDTGIAKNRGGGSGNPLESYRPIRFEVDLHYPRRPG